MPDKTKAETTTNMESTQEDKKLEKSKTSSTEEKNSDKTSEGKVVPNGHGNEEKNEDKKKSDTEDKTASPVKNEAQTLLAQGKRHLFVKDYPQAAATLGEACGKLSELYGDLADECSDAYFCYGRALLELSREESNVLGAAVERQKESDDSDEAEDEEAGGEKDEEENKKSSEKDKKENKGDDDENKEANDEENKEADDEENKEDSGEENKEEGDDDAEEKDDDVNNLQLAWEVFELAKIIFERQKSDAKLAETYLYLGEVALESENYGTAIEDMKMCLDIQKRILSPDHRDIAETLFQLGIAYSLSNQCDEAVDYFKQSLNVLEDRIKNLESKEKPDSATSGNPFYSVENEITEIKNLLPEIKEKITDIEDFKKEAVKSIMEATLKGGNPISKDGASSSSSSSAACGSSVQNGTVENKPATNISHLIRKKRKPEDDAENEKGKKICTSTTNDEKPKEDDKAKQ